MKHDLDVTVADLATLSAHDVQEIWNLLIAAYAATEAEIWGENYVRMPLEEFLPLVEHREVLIARVDSEIVGTIQVHAIDQDTYGFGLLAADFNKKGLGIGRALITAAEEKARMNGAATMRIEILRPRDTPLPFKQVLAGWYERMGYRYCETTGFLDLKPEKSEKAKLLRVPAVFDVYEKSLA